MASKSWFCVVAFHLAAAAPASAQTGGAKPSMPPTVMRSFEAGMVTDLAQLHLNTREARERVATHGLAWPADVRPKATFDDQRWGMAGVTVWVAFPGGVSHWHAYTIAEARGQQFRMGGFESPEVLALSRTLGPAKGAELARAASLAALADDNGANQFAVTDTLRSRDKQGGLFVVLSTKSFSEHAYVGTWTKLRHVFLFDSKGQLLSWSTTPVRDRPTRP